MKFRLKDIVLVTAGKDKGKQGKIVKLFPKRDRVLVEGVNFYVRHIKKQGERSGEKVRKERSLPTASIAIINPSTKKPDRIGYQVSKSGEKVRIFKKTGKEVDKK